MNIFNNQMATLRATFFLEDGVTKTDKLGSKPEWASEDTGLITLVPAEDGFSCTIVCNPGATGNVNVNVTANADLKGGFREVNAQVNFDVLAPAVPEAVSATITVEEVVDQ